MGKLIGHRRASHDHFEPVEEIDPKAQRNLRGYLEQFDYTAYAANRKLLSQTVGVVDAAQIQKMAHMAALARTRWVVAAMALSDQNDPPTRDQVAALTHLRTTFEELTGAYDGLRRMVERGYLGFNPTTE